MRTGQLSFMPDQAARPSPARAWSRNIVQGIVLALAMMIALLSLRYVAGVGPIPPNIEANRYRSYWLVAHAGFASLALLIGAIQFSAVLRKRRPTVHRIVGRVYVISCLCGACAGFTLALGTTRGWPAGVGFGALAGAWLVTNAIGWRQAMHRQFASHRRWMIRSWALTLSAVTLRLYLPLSEALGLPEDPAYVAISFLCWVPNLAIAELWLHRKADPGYQTGGRMGVLR